MSILYRILAASRSRVVSRVLAPVGIVAALRNRHDKTMRAMTWGLVGVASIGLTVYFVVSLTRGWFVHVRSVAGTIVHS